MNDIPRYKASFPLQKVFVSNHDFCGDHVFTQVARKGNVAVYRRNKVSDGRVFCFETIVIKTVKEGTTYAKGAAPTVHDTESYPGAKSKLGWYYPTLEAALAKMEDLTKEEVKPETVGLGGWIVPAMEFTFTEFAKANELPIDKTTATIIQNLLREKSLKLIRTEVRNGKSTQIFGKVWFDKPNPIL
jgi:hypothetical protein